MVKTMIRRSKNFARANRSAGNGSAAARSKQMLATMVAFCEGNFSVRLPSDWGGIDGQIAAAFNEAISREDRLSREMAQLSRLVGREGRLNERMSAPGVNGRWAAKVECFNTLLDDLARPIMGISRTIGAVTKGDLRQSMELDVDGRLLKGEFLRSAKLVNAMIDRLAIFTAAVEIGEREVAEAAISPITAADQLERWKVSRIDQRGKLPWPQKFETVRKQQAMIDHGRGGNLESVKPTSEQPVFSTKIAKARG